jgi:hypothetical protein
MIGQYLPNNNEKSYSVVLQNFLHLNQPKGTESGFIPIKLKKSDNLLHMFNINNTGPTS